MDFDPKNIADEASAKAAATGSSAVDQAKEKVGDVVDQVKEKVGGVTEQLKEKAGGVVDQVKEKAGGVTDSLKEKASEVIAKGADMLDGLADKLKS